MPTISTMYMMSPISNNCRYIIYIVDIVDMALTINKINIRHSLYCGHGELTHLVVPRTCLGCPHFSSCLNFLGCLHFLVIFIVDVVFTFEVVFIFKAVFIFEVHFIFEVVLIIVVDFIFEVILCDPSGSYHSQG